MNPSDYYITSYFGENPAARAYLEVTEDPFTTFRSTILMAGDDYKMALKTLDERNNLVVWPALAFISGMERIVLPKCECWNSAGMHNSVAYYMGDHSVSICTNCKGMNWESYMGRITGVPDPTAYLCPISRRAISDFLKDYPPLMGTGHAEDAYQDKYPSRCGCGARAYIGLRFITCSRTGCPGRPVRA